jgi:hypothetical protein
LEAAADDASPFEAPAAEAEAEAEADAEDDDAECGWYRGYLRAITQPSAAAEISKFIWSTSSTCLTNNCASATNCRWCAPGMVGAGGGERIASHTHKIGRSITRSE